MGTLSASFTRTLYVLGSGFVVSSEVSKSAPSTAFIRLRPSFFGTYDADAMRGSLANFDARSLAFASSTSSFK